jgi:hypothetical protein
LLDLERVDSFLISSKRTNQMPHMLFHNFGIDEDVTNLDDNEFVQLFMKDQFIKIVNIDITFVT